MRYYRRKKYVLPACSFIKEKIKFIIATKKQIMDAVFMNIRNCKFRERLSLFIKESENTKINYAGKKHKSDFNKSLERIDQENLKTLFAAYLLTANEQLWRKVQNQVEKNCIRFDKINLGSVDEKAYTLLSALQMITNILCEISCSSARSAIVMCFGLRYRAFAPLVVRRFGIGVLNQN